MTQYVIIPSPGADPVGEPFGELSLHSTVMELAGRNPLAFGSVRTALRRNGSVYIAANRYSAWRTQGGGQGFIVKRVES